MSFFPKRVTESGFEKYKDEFNKICLDEYGIEWDEKKETLKTNRETYRGKDGKRHYIDNVDIRHHLKEIFLSQWLNRVGAYESFLYLLNEWIDEEWGWSHELDCYILMQLSNKPENPTFDEILNLVRCHKEFNETEAQTKKRLEKNQRIIDNEYKDVKRIQSSLGYFVRKYLNLKAQFLYQYFPKLEAKYKKKSIFRTLKDELADFEKRELDSGNYYGVSDAPSDPVWRFKEIQEMFINCDSVWFRSKLEDATEIILTKLKRKEDNIKSLEDYDLCSLYCSLCFKYLNNENWKDKKDFWIGFSSSKNEKKHDEFFKLIAGFEQIKELFHGKKSSDSRLPHSLEGETYSFIFLCRLHETCYKNKVWKTYWDEEGNLSDTLDSMKPAIFAQQIISERHLNEKHIFGANFRFYRLLDMLEEYESSKYKNWDDFMKKNYFFFDSKHGEADV